MLEAGVLDTHLGKHWGIKLATNAAVTVLRVDQVSWHNSIFSFVQYWNTIPKVNCNIRYIYKNVFIFEVVFL